MFAVSKKDKEKKHKKREAESAEHEHRKKKHEPPEKKREAEEENQKRLAKHEQADKKHKEKHKKDKDKERSLANMFEKALKKGIDDMIEKTVEKTVERVVEKASENAAEIAGRVIDSALRDTPAKIDRSEVVLEPGDTIWSISEKRYGTAQVAAVYEASGMIPDVVSINGSIEFRDPVPNAGDRLVLPAENELETLRQKYEIKLRALRYENRAILGMPDESTRVRLVYGDTLFHLAQLKYGKAVPAEALFEANQLSPTAGDDGTPQDPIYFAGRWYRLPAESEIELLAQQYRQRLEDM